MWTDAPFSRGAKAITASATDCDFNADIAEQKAGNVVVDPEAWTALVRQAYKDYNAAIIAVVREQKRS